MRGLSIAIVVLAACGRFGFDPHTGGGDDVQPNGDAQGNGDGNGTGDGGTGDGAIDAPALISPNCGTTVLINDDFGDGAIGSQWTMVTSAGYTVNEAGGNVAVTFPATANANTRAGYRQVASVPFANVCAIAEITGVPASAQAFVYVRLGTPTLNVEMYVQAGNLTARFTNGGTSATIGGATAWSATNHRFLRVRNTGGTNYVFEAGPSLTSFPTFLGSQGGILLNNLSPSSLEIGGSTSTMAASGAGTVRFESVTFLAP
ncbi:MAG TPA: hypothetical protein VIV11_41100 [Kofleriaceae bacterium]